MTTASIRTIPQDAHGLERLAVKAGLALVRWGQVRAERVALSRDELMRRAAVEHSLAQREHAARRYGITA